MYFFRYMSVLMLVSPVLAIIPVLMIYRWVLASVIPKYLGYHDEIIYVKGSTTGMTKVTR